MATNLTATNLTATNETKKFTWASVVLGKKQPLPEVESERAKEREKNTAKERAQLEKSKEETLRQKHHEEYFKRENGYWKKHFPTRMEYLVDPESGFERPKRLDVPNNVNERAMKFILFMLANFPEVTTTCKTVKDFRKFFMEAYMPYVKKFYDIKTVEENCAKFAQLNSSPNETLVDQYFNLQGWVEMEEKQFNSEQTEFIKNGGRCAPMPPWNSKLWIFAKNITVNACFWAIDERSKTFEMETKTGDAFNTGFVKIAGMPFEGKSELTWLTDLETYQDFPHNRKPEWKQKREERFEWFNDV